MKITPKEVKRRKVFMEGAQNWKSRSPKWRRQLAALKTAHTKRKSTVKP